MRIRHLNLRRVPVSPLCVNTQDTAQETTFQTVLVYNCRPELRNEENKKQDSNNTFAKNKKSDNSFLVVLLQIFKSGISDCTMTGNTPKGGNLKNMD